MKISIGNYASNPKGIGEGEMDLYSLKELLSDLSNSNHIFDNFEKESMVIDKETLEQIGDFSHLLKIRKLASELKNKKAINEKLHTLHFNLNILKNSDSNDIKPIKNAFNSFLYDNETRIDTLISELNDFKTKLDEIKKYHSSLLPKSLDNKLKIESKYNKHIEYLHSIHKKQKNALISIVKLFLKLTKNHIKNLKNFK